MALMLAAAYSVIRTAISAPDCESRFHVRRHGRTFGLPVQRHTCTRQARGRKGPRPRRGCQRPAARARVLTEEAGVGLAFVLLSDLVEARALRGAAVSAGTGGTGCTVSGEAEASRDSAAISANTSRSAISQQSLSLPCPEPLR